MAQCKRGMKHDDRLSATGLHGRLDAFMSSPHSGGPDPTDPALVPQSEAFQQPELAGNTTPSTLKLHAEELRVEKRVVESDRVRIRVVTDETDTPVSVMLRSESLDVKRVPIGRIVDQVPEDREEDGVTIISVVEEVVVTEVRLVLKEELHIRRVATVREHQDVVTLRRQRAEIDRLSPAEEDFSGS